MNHQNERSRFVLAGAGNPIAFKFYITVMIDHCFSCGCGGQWNKAQCKVNQGGNLFHIRNLRWTGYNLRRGRLFVKSKAAELFKAALSWLITRHPRTYYEKTLFSLYN